MENQNIKPKPNKKTSEDPNYFKTYFMQDTTVDMDFLRPNVSSKNKKKITRKPIEVEDEFPEDTTANMDFQRQNFFVEKPISPFVREYGVPKKPVKVEDEGFSWMIFPDKYPDVPYVDVDYVHGTMDSSKLENYKPSGFYPDVPDVDVDYVYGVMNRAKLETPKNKKPIYVPMPCVPKTATLQEELEPEKVCKVEKHNKSLEETQ